MNESELGTARQWKWLIALVLLGLAVFLGVKASWYMPANQELRKQQERAEELDEQRDENALSHDENEMPTSLTEIVETETERIRYQNEAKECLLVAMAIEMGDSEEAIMDDLNLTKPELVRRKRQILGDHAHYVKQAYKQEGYNYDAMVEKVRASLTQE